MIRRLLMAPLCLCAFLAAVPTRSVAAPLAPNKVSTLLENLQKHFPIPEREQQRVLRSLRLEIGVENPPVLDAPKARRWMQSPFPPTANGLLKRMRDELQLARRFVKSPDLETRRVALSLALKAANSAREGGDMPLNTAIGIGFLLPSLLDAPTTGKESRFQILCALEEPFSIFELLPGDDEHFPLPDNKAALDFEWLQMALAPTPREANWPRVRLARRLIRGNGTATDRAAAYNKAGAREAFAALRALVPGEGTLFFRYSMPALAKQLGEKLTSAERIDSAQAVRENSRMKLSLGAEALETLDTLRALCHHSPQDKAALIQETAQRCDFAPGEREQLDAEADKSFDTVIDRFDQQSTENPRPRALLYRGYYVALRALNAALQYPDPKNIQRKISVLEKVSYWWQDDAILYDTPQWRFGNYHYNAEFDVFSAQIAENFLVDAVPFMDRDMTYWDDTQSRSRAFPNTFLKAYPNWSPVRVTRSIAEFQAQKHVQERKRAAQVLYDPSVNARMCGLARASCDLLARTGTTENSYDQTLDTMMGVLSSQNRLEDILLILDLQWEREHFTLDQQSDNAYWTKQTNAQLQASFSFPTVLRPLP